MPDSNSDSDIDAVRRPPPDAHPLFDPITVDRVADSVVEQVEDLIASGALRPGDRFPPEREMAERMRVSRPKLREALHRLERAGLIEIRRNDGAFVAALTRPVLTEPMKALCTRHAAAFLDFLEYRREQEAFAARCAALRATAEDRVAMSRAIDAMERAHQAGREEAMARSDLDFHVAVVEAAHNAMLLHVMRSIYDLTAHGVFRKRDHIYHGAGPRAELLAQHRTIADAIAAGDAEAAARASDRHLDHVADAFRAAEAAETRSRTARKRAAATSLPARRRSRDRSSA